MIVWWLSTKRSLNWLTQRDLFEENSIWFVIVRAPKRVEF